MGPPPAEQSAEAAPESEELDGDVEQAEPERELTEARLTEEAVAAHTEVDTASVEVVLQAEIQLAAGTERAALSAEDINAVRAEAGVDTELQAMGEEAQQLARAAKAEIDAAAGIGTVNPDAATIAEKKSEQDVETAARLEQVRERLVRRPEESPSAYLFRAGEEITALLLTNILFDENRVKEADLSVVAKELITRVVQQTELAMEAPIRPDRARNEEAVRRIEGEIGVHGVAGSKDSEDTLTYDKTTRNRMLFEKRPGKSTKRETYWSTLVFTFNTVETRALAKKMLDGKSLLLLGGGRARLGEEMSQHNIAPEKILNADPFVEDVQSGADPVVPVSSADADLPTRLREQGMLQADEIWAEFSVPAYLDKPEEITGMFQNIDAALVEGGTARVWPLAVKRGSDAEVEARKVALQGVLRSLAERGDYELTAYEAAGRLGVTLRKAKQETLPNPTE